MNNNRNNNRRRSRGNNRGGGNPMQGNRIDSRARGNAPQMLDKYKKLAHEAQLNDDRVQTEYYLQFADHYFRVIADNKAQKEEARAKRDGERGDGSSDDDDQDDDNRQQRSPRGRKQDNRPRKDSRPEKGSEGEDGDQADEDNPFTRDADTPKPKRARRKKVDNGSAADNEGGIDPSMLPPAIARADDSDDGDADDDGDTGDDATASVAKPRKLSTRRKPKSDDDGDLKAVG